jgi:hypothetical protein
VCVQVSVSRVSVLFVLSCLRNLLKAVKCMWLFSSEWFERSQRVVLDAEHS